jgi:hypothetical protein
MNELLTQIVKEWTEAEKAFNNCAERFSSTHDIPAESRTIIDRYFEMNTHLYEIGEEWDQSSFTDMDTHLLYCAMKAYVKSCMMSEMCPGLIDQGKGDLAAKIMCVKTFSVDVIRNLAGVEE